MWTRECFVLVCLTVCCSARPDSAITGFGMELLLTKLNILQDNLVEMEQKMNLRDSNQEEKESARYVNTQAKLDRIENKLNRIVPYSSCKEMPTKESGKYEIQFGFNKTRLSVYCVQHAFGGGWIVFQDRYTGNEDFNRNWTDYRDGFGDPKREFWLGLKYLHQLTSERPHELIVQVKDFNENQGYAHYDQFMIGSESEGYSLKIGKYNGTAGDALAYHRDMKFSTKDKDNDILESQHCALNLQGGWWFRGCSNSYLNGVYGNNTDWQGKSRVKEMYWYQFKNDFRSLSYSRMMIRELD